MRTYYLPFLTLLLVPVHTVLAQGADTTEPRRADSLRQRIEERFASRVQSELGLTNEQTAKLKATSQAYSGRRRDLRDRAMRVREALAKQLQPGVAANQDSVAKLTDAMIDLKLSSAQLTRDEMKDVSKYLTPVQRARLLVMRERFMERVHEHGHNRGGGDRGGRRRPGDQSSM
jgi:Spy/CpxP family protein refolding chaperone